mgnify:CR=1 FL=1
MQGPDVSRILSRWPYPEAAVAAYSSAMTAAFNDPEARSAIESAMSDYAAGRRLDARALLAHLESLRSAACTVIQCVCSRSLRRWTRRR